MPDTPGPRGSYRFALRPLWILSHLLVLGLVVAMVNLGLWQLRRLDDRRDRNATITDRVDLPAEPVEEITSGLGVGDGADVEFRPVTATGRYEIEDQVVVRNRSFEGAAGTWVLTPLRLDDGRAVVVNRGWVPASVGADDDLTDAPAPTGTVTVEGLARATQVAEGLQRADPSGGVLTSLARADLGRYQEQLDYELLPVYVQLEAQQPAPGELPIPVPRPDLDEGPHLGYAVQWFVFTTIAVVGYPLVLRRVARDRRGSVSDSGAEAPW